MLQSPSPPPPSPDYDDLLYDELPHPDTHPDRLATLATLFSLTPAPIERCRVLELGCGLGSNILPLAALLPQSTFVGVDLSARQIEHAIAQASTAGIPNAAFRAANILDIDSDFGTFDYILCHGVYSWVPPDVQKKILTLCRALLAPSGIATISFNTYPGWHLRGMLRDILRREVGPQGSPRERIQRARDVLALLAHAPHGQDPAHALLAAEIDILNRMSDQYLFYEHLVEHNHPCYFQDFARDAASAGLQYLGDANFHTMMPERFGPEAAAEIARRSHNILETEHNIDLLDVRFFRRALLCHQEAPIDRDVKASRIDAMWVDASLSPTSPDPDLHSDAPETFSKAGGAEIATSTPLLKAALMLLSMHHPRGLHFGELYKSARSLIERAAPEDEDRDRLGKNLLGLYTKGQIDLGLWLRPIALTPGERPTTSPWIRLQAARGLPGCTNLRHQSIAVDKLDRALLARLDGTRTRADLVDGVLEDVNAGKLSIEVDGVPCRDREMLLELIHKELDWLASAAFLMI